MVKIKTRNRSRLTKALDTLEGEGYQFHRKSRRRPLEIGGWDGPGLYEYDYVSNQLRKIAADNTVRFYRSERDSDNYIEFVPNNKWVIVRALGRGLRALTLKAQALNWFELASINSFTEKGEDNWE